MPEQPIGKFGPRRPKPESTPSAPASPCEPPYAELQVTTNYTFLTGASHPDELVTRAAELGYRAIGVTDRNTLAGVVRAHVAAKEAGIQLLVGTRVAARWKEQWQSETPMEAAAQDGAAALSFLLFPTTMAAYSCVCNLLTLGKRRAPKGECHLSVHDVVQHLTEGAGRDVMVVLAPPVWRAEEPPGDELVDLLADLRRSLGESGDDRVSLAMTRLMRDDDAQRLHQLSALASHIGLPLVATGDVHYHQPGRRALHDVLACIKRGCTLEQAGLNLHPSPERHLRPPAEAWRLLDRWPQALRRTTQIAERCRGFSLDQLRYQYPSEVVPPGRTAMEHLTELVWQGAAERYPADPAPAVRRQVEHELRLIAELNYAHYFLTVHDLVRYARSRGILCQGRGAAANSAVCYCLGVTSVDPDRIDVLFERFISRERDEPPDIDIDFEHERREEVIQYIYGKYGRHRAALTAEVITYRGRSAVREVGKALGLSLDAVEAVARNIDWWEGGVPHEHRLREIGLDPADRTIGLLMELTGQILGFPRHLSQHVGGFVITQAPLSDLVPIENAAMDDRTVIEWDKDDIDAVGMLKVDVLGLGMLTCISKCMAMVNRMRAGEPAGPEAPSDRSDKPLPLCPSAGTLGAASSAPLLLHTIPAEDPAVYDMVCNADTIGVFQIESRAQMSMLPRLKPRCFYDLVIEVAIVRPGPIQGKMVHPYLRRRDGLEPVVYPDASVERVLGKTLGVPLFQEQAMQLAIVAAGFTPGEADQLRRAIAAWKSRQNVIHRFGEKLIAGMTARGYPLQFAQRCFEQIKGFSEYGFPESHAASFALLVYASAWLKLHYPAAFAAALLNSQPMGFYSPAQIVRDARDHGVEVRPADVNRSGWDCAVESAAAMRLGLRLVSGLREEEARLIEQAVRARGPARSIESLWRLSGARLATLRLLAEADAFGSMGLDRQRALWTVGGLVDEDLPLFDRAAAGPDQTDQPACAEQSFLPAVPARVQVEADYSATGLSLKAHPISFMREALRRRGVVLNSALADAAATPAGKPAAVAGMVLVRQRPHTANGVMFMTIEDETGPANLIIWPDVYARYRAAARHGTVVIARGAVQRQGRVVHVIVRSLTRADGAGSRAAVRSRDFH